MIFFLFLLFFFFISFFYFFFLFFANSSLLQSETCLSLVVRLSLCFRFSRSIRRRTSALSIPTDFPNRFNWDCCRQKQFHEIWFQHEILIENDKHLIIWFIICTASHQIYLYVTMSQIFLINLRDGFRFSRFEFPAHQRWRGFHEPQQHVLLISEMIKYSMPIIMKTLLHHHIADTFKDNHYD